MLTRAIETTARQAGARRIAVAFHDYQTETSFSYRGGQWFHAASTIKVAVLLALFEHAESTGTPLGARLHVRNRFLSAHDGSSYRVEPGREAGGAVFAQVGKLMHLRELAEHMITTSSNLATNLLVDYLGAEWIAESLQRHGIAGVEVVRGVEDHAAHEARIDNRITARGYLELLRLLIDERGPSQEASEEMLAILRRQEFRRGIPAGLPDHAEVANKTGEISTVCHDGAVVHLPDRRPYVVTILSEWEAGAGDRRATVARISQSIYEHLTAEADGGVPADAGEAS